MPGAHSVQLGEENPMAKAKKTTKKTAKSPKAKPATKTMTKKK